MSTAVLVIVDYTNTSCHSSYVTTSTSQESPVRLGGACRTIHLHACELGMYTTESCASACLYCRLSVFIHVHGALSAYRVTDIFNSIPDTLYHRPFCESGVTIRAAHHFVKLHEHVCIVEYLSAQPCQEPLSSEPRLRPVQSSYHRKNHNECFMTYSSTTAGYAKFSAVTTSAHHLLVCTSIM